MTTRDLFGSDNPQKIISNESTDELGKNVESSGNLQQRLQEKDRFIPLADFRTPSSFARYGSAEKYYTNAISRIYSDYPYDGSLKEKTEFRNESTYLDLYMLDNKYPRTTGYITISPNGWGTQAATSSFGGSPDIIGKPSIIEYIQIVGGPHTASGGMEGKSLSATFDKSNLYDASKNRESNLRCNFDNGTTVEFWMNKPTASLMTGSTAFEMLYHLSNENSGSIACLVRTEDSADDTLPRIQVVATTPTQIASHTIPALTNTEILDGKWHHYATSIQNSGSFVKFKTYYDGKLVDDAAVSLFIGSAPLLEITGALKMNIGASRKAIYTISPTVNVSFPDDGWCKLSGSIDEFRYWKTARSSEQIGKYWFTQFGGGTNADDSNTDLGVYYKFNEGITGVSSIDSTVLDYSGRISNGVWAGYSSNARSTGSAIDLHLKKNSEFRDPIIYQAHPEVTLLTTKMVASASAYDVTNNSSIYNSVPSWITEEDEQHGGDLSKLTQIMASYFDNLHLQIEALPRLKDKVYTDPSIKKPKTFASRLLETQGFVAPELFANAGVLEQIANRDDDEKFELDLVDIKNSIYQNVYNNLINIYKSKGTTESFRNLIRCFGVDDELVRLNIYGNNVDHEIKDAYRNTTVKKKFADFNHPDRFRSTTFQQTASSNPNSVSFITASSNSSYLPFTIESEFVFPKKLSRDNPNWFDTLFLSSSLFGYHGVTAVTDSLGWPTIGSDNNVQVYAVREELESKNVYFQLRDRAGSFNLTSSIFDGVYDNQKWNLALRYIPHNTSSNLVSGSATGNATLELYGVSSDAGIINNSFNLSTPVSAAYGKTSKRLYLGSHRTNFTGSSISETDVKASSLRYWASNLNDSVIQLHARDPSNYGVTSPYQSAYLYNTQLTGVSVPQIETLALNWDFSTVTSSDGGISGVPTVSDAGFEIPDFSSGSISLSSRYKWLGEIINRQHTGRGAIYLPNDSKVVDVKYLYSGKQTAPEVIQSSDAINISDNEDIYFDRSSRPTNFYYSFEKSMYQTISDEMLNIFATITDFNNLIGDPVNRYRQNYKEMEKLRQLFFERVENTPSLDKYIEFYKWIDNSLNIMLQQLTPLSADTSDGVRTMVESHVLERNKYWSKFPSLEMEQKDPEGGAQGINKLSYNWKYGHSPIGITSENTNCWWWENRAARTGSISSGDAQVDADRQKIFNVSVSALNRSYSTPYRLHAAKEKQIKGGTNAPGPNTIEILRSAMSPGTSDGVHFVSFDDLPQCQDDSDLETPRLQPTPFASTPESEYLAAYADFASPATIFSSSIKTGYQSQFAGGTGIAMEGLHRDIYGPDSEIPAQGPFTDALVGGLQYRNVPPMTLSASRPEGWKFVLSSNSNFEYPSLHSPRATHYRDGTARRPVNIKNIKINSLGNYSKNHQVIQSSGRHVNNLAWVSSSGWDLAPLGIPSIYISGLLDTPKIDFGKNETVIVNRFSAPGGADTAGDANGGPSLDRYSAEYSPYNQLTYRNKAVRHRENRLLTSHVNQFGYFSNTGHPLPASSSVNPLNYNGTGSVYQVNRNTRRRMEMSASTILTSSVYDNYWVNHPIPQSDLQYSWINAAYESANPSGLGYWYEGLFEYVASEKVVAEDHFTSSIGSIWTHSGVEPRQSIDSTNWIVRFGETFDPTADRSLATVEEYTRPFRVDYSYARGPYQDLDSKEYVYFDTNLGVLSGSGPSLTSATGRNTISLWINQEGRYSGNVDYIFAWHDSGANRVKSLNAAGFEGRTLTFVTEFGTTQADCAGQLPAQTGWHHVVIVSDDVDPSFVPRIYINGALSTSSPQAGAGLAPTLNGAFTLGGVKPISAGFGTRNFPGSIDSVSWWGSELTDANIAELYNSGTPGFVNQVSFAPDWSSISSTQTAHYWQMGDANADSISFGSTSIYDWGSIPGAHDVDLTALGSGDIQIKEYTPGYNMRGLDTTIESLQLQYSLDSGVSWLTASTLTDPYSARGAAAGFSSRNHLFIEDPADTSNVKIRFWQKYGYETNNGKDNWALNSVKISEISETSPVEFSPFGDFSSRYYSIAPNLKYGNTNATIAASVTYDIFLPTVYTNLNYNIYEPIDPDNQYQGYPLTSQSIDYLNSKAIPDGFANNLDDGVWTPELSKATLLNAILLKRNGPYQYPNWKQIRTGEGTLATYYRNNNIITVTQQPGRNKRLGGEKYIEPFGKTYSFREPAIDSKYSPIETELGLRVETSDDSGESKFIVRPVTLASPYGNNLAYFDNPKLNKLAKFDDDSNSYIKQPYDVVKDLYLNGELGSLESPVYSFINLKYQERVYPASRNIYAKNIRERKDFSNTFWRDSRANRDALGTKKFDGKTSQGIVHAQSAWGLDGRDSLTEPAPSPADSPGELQNGYTLLVKATPLGTPHPENVKPSPMYTRKQDIGSLYSVVSPNGMSNLNRDITSSVYVTAWEYPGHNLINWPGSSSVGFFNGITGDAQWQAGELAGKVIDKQFVSQSSKPFYDTYDKFNEHLRLKNKDYSIIPEFRISEQMEYYHDERGGDFLAANKNIFSIFGSPSASSGEADFFKTYSYTDFMKYFEVIDTDHEDMSDLGKTLSLKCKALKKFVPYDGFYPAERTLQIASQFSSSYSSYITASGDFEYKDTPVRMRPLLQPFMAPGVLYNTIKSGIAVDYPVYTGSFARINYATGHPSGSTAWGIKTWLNDDFTEGSGAPYVNGINTDNWIFDETSDGPDLREDSGGSGNWIFRFRGTHSPDKRYLITKNSYQSPVQVTFNFARGNFQNGLTPGYDLELPAVGDDFHFEYSTNGGTSWLTQSVFQRGTTAAGTFIPHTASFPASSGTVTFRWRQIDWAGVNNDNWGLDDVKIETAFTSSTYWGIGPKLSTDGTSLSENQGWDYRVPFEAILDPELVNGIKFIDMEVNPQFKLSSSAAVTNIPSMTTVLSAPATKNLYKLMTSNFLAETTEFFLKQGKLSSFKSNVSDSGFEFKSGSYAMRVRMRRSMNRERRSPTPWQLPVDWYDQTNLNETITMYSKPNSFGPPVVGSGHVWSTGSMSGSTRGRQQNSDSLFGRNPSFTPPYYDGECWYDIIYTTSEDRVLPLEEFFMSASVYSLRIPTNSSAWPNNYIYLSPGVSGSFAYPNPAGVEAKYFPMNSASANNYAMKMDSSINLFSKEFVDSQISSTGFSPRWVIQPKMETPVLNFGDTTKRPLGFHNIDLPQGGDPVDSSFYDEGYFGKTTTPIGMWHQFGLIPQKDEGIHLSIEDVPQPWLESKSSIYPAAANTKSLIDVVGFKKNASRKLGKLAESKTVHEAVVAIPYIIEDGQRKFFTIDRELIDNSVKKLAGEDISAPIPGGSIIDMVSGMQKYILPPRMDFVANPDIDPFAIYLFEFSHTFDQDDLSYMWQNMMPTNLGANFEEDSAIVSHKLVDRQVLEAFKDRVRWVVFKAKQRGNNNYYSLIAGSTPEKSQQEKYSYNWPYDYFSLVEFVNINSEVEYSTDAAINVGESFAEINKGLQKGIRSTKELVQAPSKIIKSSSGLSKVEAEAQKATIERENREIRKTTGAFGTTSGSPKNVPDTED